MVREADLHGPWVLLASPRFRWWPHTRQGAVCVWGLAQTEEYALGSPDGAHPARARRGRDAIRLDLELVDERRFDNGMVYLSYRSAT